MKEFVKRMVEEHSELVVRTQKLHNYVYGEESDKDNKVEFANKCIQLGAMKKYEEALRARLENQNVVFEDGEYFEKIGEIRRIVAPETSNNNEEGQNAGKKE